jgi:hypothetical protein
MFYMTTSFTIFILWSTQFINCQRFGSGPCPIVKPQSDFDKTKVRNIIELIFCIF